MFSFFKSISLGGKIYIGYTITTLSLVFSHEGACRINKKNPSNPASAPSIQPQNLFQLESIADLPNQAPHKSHNPPPYAVQKQIVVSPKPFLQPAKQKEML